MARTTTTDVPAPPPRLEPSAAAGRQLASLPPEIIERILSIAALPAIVRANATARLFRGEPGGRSPVEHALRERAHARGHARALPASLPVDACTWTDALMQREAVLSLVRAHAHAVATTPGAGVYLSAFVDAEGGLHTCGEEKDEDEEDEEGTGEYHASPAAGHPDAHTVLLPTRVASLSAVRVVAVAAGRSHLLALSQAGAVYGCGDNECGQLGLGDTVTRWGFEQVRGVETQLVVCIAAGDYHSLALTAAGCAYSWGYNYCGQLGHGDTEERWEPTRIEALDGVRVGGVAAGDSHTLLLSAQGAVYSCGWGSSGQLGHDREREQLTPRRIEALAGVRAVHASAGHTHSLVVDAAGGVHFFGSGRSGQLGHGGRLSAFTPFPIPALVGVRAVRACAGFDSSAVLGADGSVHTFGDNEFGQLSAPGNSRRLFLPARVQAFEAGSVLDCALCGTHALYTTADGAVYACGLQSAALGLGVSAASVPEGSAKPLSWPPTRIEQLQLPPPLQPGSWTAIS